MNVYYPIFPRFRFGVDSSFFSPFNSNIDALSFWSKLGQLSQVLILFFGLKSVVKMFIYLSDIRIKNSYNYKKKLFIQICVFRKEN